MSLRQFGEHAAVFLAPWLLLLIVVLFLKLGPLIHLPTHHLHKVKAVHDPPAWKLVEVQ